MKSLKEAYEYQIMRVETLGWFFKIYAKEKKDVLLHKSKEFFKNKTKAFYAVIEYINKLEKGEI